VTFILTDKLSVKIKSSPRAGIESPSYLIIIIII
jgi:hypothetical protein